MKIISFLLLFSLGGCQMDQVKPWQRGYLAKPIMQDDNSLIKSLDQHTFLSKEASSGGNGVASGGCGCN